MKKVITLSLAAVGVLWTLSQRRKAPSNDTWAAGTDAV